MQKPRRSWVFACNTRFARSNLFARKQKSEAFLLRSLYCICKPDSVPPAGGGQSFIWDEYCYSPQAALLLPRVVATSTALHAGRNFAVAPEALLSRFNQRGETLLVALASQLERLCSHP
jgi:hypothetical protein